MESHFIRSATTFPHVHLPLLCIKAVLLVTRSNHTPNACSVVLI
jgi:hypothetical protein